VNAAGRHRHARPATPALVRFDRSGGLALAFLAFAGLAGPAWALRGHADSVVGAARPMTTAAPDASLPRSASGK
jgi:hypothetical protein